MGVKQYITLFVLARIGKAGCRQQTRPHTETRRYQLDGAVASFHCNGNGEDLGRLARFCYTVLMNFCLICKNFLRQ